MSNTINRLKRKSYRLQGWDYSSNGSYFITLCTKNRFEYFGRVENNEMILSKIGIIADIFWYEIKNRVQNITLGDFVVMPNHIHMILTINNPNDDKSIVGTLHATSQQKNQTATSQQNNQTATSQQNNQTATSQQNNQTATSQQNNQTATSQQNNQTATSPQTIQSNDNNCFDPAWYSRISPKTGSISAIIRSYKSAVSKHAHRLGFEFQWQPKFYDHIIRNDEDFIRISKYIRNNPLNYSDDRFKN